MLMTTAERRLLAGVVFFLAAGQLLAWLRHGGCLPDPDGWPTAPPGSTTVIAETHPAPARPPVAESLFGDGYLDINRADSLALLALPGIGPALAGRILAHRRAHGSLRTVGELRAVRGIGPKRLAELEELVRVRGDR